MEIVDRTDSTQRRGLGPRGFRQRATARTEGLADEFREQARRDEARAAEEERMDEEARESFPASDPPSHTGIKGEGRRGR